MMEKNNNKVANMSQVCGFNQQWLMEMKLLQKGTVDEIKYDEAEKKLM
jgi:hypothetical protein